MDARSEPFLVLATVCLRLSMLSIHEPMCKCINAPMFLSRGDASGPTMRKWGYAVQPLVKRRDDLLFNALEGLDVTGRDGAEHDLVDTGVNELADSIDDVI